MRIFIIPLIPAKYSEDVKFWFATFLYIYGNRMKKIRKPRLRVYRTLLICHTRSTELGKTKKQETPTIVFTQFNVWPIAASSNLIAFNLEENLQLISPINFSLGVN